MVIAVLFVVAPLLCVHLMIHDSRIVMTAHPLVYALLPILLTSCEGMDGGDRDFKYRDWAHAQAEEAISGHGWLPEFLPRSAKDIRDSHNCESNEGWSTFTFDPQDKPAFVARMTPIGFEQVPYPQFRSTKKRSWWPQDLTGYNARARQDYAFYSYRLDKDTQIIVAIEDGRPQAWCWWVLE